MEKILTNLICRCNLLLKFLFLLAVDTKVSLLFSSISAVLIFSAMQLYKPAIASSQVLTIVGGFGGSWFFLLSLTVRVANKSLTFLQEIFERFKRYPKKFKLLNSLDLNFCKCFILSRFELVQKSLKNSLKPHLHQHSYMHLNFPF